MAEQISRRSNNVTQAPLDVPFETQIVRFGVGGLNLSDALDAAGGWTRHTNLWHAREQEITARHGQTVLATHPAGSTCHSVHLLRCPRSGDTTRLWGIDTTLHHGLDGTTTEIDTGYSGDPLALVPHRPTLSGDPWMFIGDRTRMRKVRADGLDLPIGLPSPTALPTTALAPEYRVNIALCEAEDGTEAVKWVPIPGIGLLDIVPGPGYAVTGTPNPAAPTLTPVTPSEGIYCVTNPGTFNFKGGYDSWWGLPYGEPQNLNVLTEVGGTATKAASDDDLIHVWLKTSHPDLVTEIRLYIVVSNPFDANALPGAPLGGTAPGLNTDAYVKVFRPYAYAQAWGRTLGTMSAAEQARIDNLRYEGQLIRSFDDTRTASREAREQGDPRRAAALVLPIAAHHWFGYGQIGAVFRRGDFQRLGSDYSRDWSTATGVILYVRTKGHPLTGSGPVGVGLDDFYITGGSGLDAMEIGAQSYDYRVTNYDPRTGAESNPYQDTSSDDPEADLQPVEARLDPIRRGIVVDPPAYGDPAVRQRVYRRGGSLIDDWYFVGENDADGGTFLDEEPDDALVAAGTLATDHYQPVPTLDDNGDTVLAQPVRALWGPVQGMLLACGDPHRPGHVYYSHADAPDHWSSAGNVEVCAPSEELMNGCVAGHQAFVFSRLRAYFLYPNLSGQGGLTASPTLCTRGLLGYWSFCCGPGGQIFFCAEDGIYVTNGGPETWLSKDINPLFCGTDANGYKAIDKARTQVIRLTVWENCLFFQYEDTDGHVQVLVYHILLQVWRHFEFGQPPAVLQGEDEPLLVIGGDGTGKSYTMSGYSDDGAPIACLLRSGSMSGGRREEKLFGDLFLDADPALTDLTLQIFLNEETHENVEEVISSATAGRQRFLVHAFGASPQKAHSVACEIRWSSTTDPPPTLYQLGYAVTLQPDLTNTRVTNWDDLNSPDEVWLTGLTLDCDTGGVAKTLHVERDFGGERLLVDTLTVTSTNRHKFKFSWPAVPAHMVRLRPDANDCAPWLLYRADWIYLQEPPRISKWDIHFENQWDQYYTGLDLYCDTLGEEKRIEVYVDNVRLTNTLGGGLTYWPVTAAGRKVVHLTLPWGRGHVFRFVAIDDHPGLLYTHRWHLQEEPSEQSNWNQNFSILGTRADKWLKAIIFECDTYGVNKSVQVEVDGTVVETLTVNASGRKVVQLALSEQRLGRVWRMFPVDANPGRLYSAEPVFDEEPFALTRWETQETNHNLPGWFYPLYGHLTLKSSAPVTLTTLMQHNQVGGQTTRTYSIPSTSGQKQRRFLNGFHAGKGVLIKYILTSAEPFWLYRDETTLAIQPWGAFEPILVQPFGNDDQDPSRPMTHAVLAAQAAGGAATPVPPGGSPL